MVFHVVWKTWTEGLSKQKTRTEGHIFHTAWETMIKSYYNTLTDWFLPPSIHRNITFSALKWAFFFLTSWLLGKSQCCYELVATGHKWIIVMKTEYLLYLILNGIRWIKYWLLWKILKNALLGGPCSQHVTGNTSRLDQSQSATKCDDVHVKIKNKKTGSNAFLYRMYLLFQVTVMALSCCSTKWSNRLASILTLSKVAAMSIIILVGFVELGKGTVK